MDLILFLQQFGPWSLAPLSLLAGVLISARMQKKGALENAHIDQLQEDLKAERDERSKLGTEINSLWGIVNKMQLEGSKSRQLGIAWEDHYWWIRSRLDLGEIPPWPDTPSSVYGVKTENE